jgi:two-component system KDP operon response regulator KdpE
MIKGVIPMTHTILVLEDNEEESQNLMQQLHEEGYQTIMAQDSLDALRKLYDKRPDLAIVDVHLKEDDKLNGVLVCERIREISEIPIIMLTGNNEEETIVQSFDVGADDYMVKPYRTLELLARVRANLRRRSRNPHADRQGVIYSDGYLTVNVEERRVLKEGKHVRLSPTEFNLLVKLVENAPKVVEYEDLLQSVWGDDYTNDIDYLRVYVWHLRRKLERDPKDPYYLLNELGIGYRFQSRL